MPTTTVPRFLVMTASTQAPRSAKRPYRRVALVETDGSGIWPKMISSHARGIKRVVETWEKLSVGSTSRCAYQQALAAANEMAQKLTAEGS